MHTFKEFVRRLQLPCSDPNAPKEILINILSESLVTPEGKKRASKILGLKTFKDMYHKPSRSQRSS